MLPSSVFTRAFVLLVGLVYPSYQSYKALQNHDIRLYTQWLIYWIIYSIFLSIEKLFDQFYLWIPFYCELKVVVTLWLVSPATKGSTRLYAHHVHPFLLHWEMEIDELIKAFKSFGFSAIRRLFRYLFSLLMAAFGATHTGVIELIKLKYNLKEATPEKQTHPLKRQEWRDVCEDVPQEARSTREAPDLPPSLSSSSSSLYSAALSTPPPSSATTSPLATLSQQQPQQQSRQQPQQQRQQQLQQQRQQQLQQQRQQQLQQQQLQRHSKPQANVKPMSKSPATSQSTRLPSSSSSSSSSSLHSASSPPSNPTSTPHSNAPSPPYTYTPHKPHPTNTPNTFQKISIPSKQIGPKSPPRVGSYYDRFVRKKDKP